MRYLLKGTVLAMVLMVLAAAGASSVPSPAPRAVKPDEDVLVLPGEIGERGGRLVASLHSDPKTFNPVTVVDLPSKEVIALLGADLIHINLHTQHTEPALAKSWTVSPDGKRYTLELRRGVLFSDGHPFDADDVVFSFKVYLDENVHSPQRDLLLVGGKPIRVQKLNAYRVAFDLPQPYAAAERLFDSVSILPRHLLERAYEGGTIAKAWSVATRPAEMAGLGPFRPKQYLPGQQMVLERNPFYWKADFRKNRLPYLDEIAFLIVPTEDAEAIRFQAGDVDVVKINAENYSALEREQHQRGYRLDDLGAGFEYDFLFFNLNDLSAKQLPEIQRKQEWFRRFEFRQAVSAAIDREAIVRLAYQGRATPLWEQVTPANKLWINQAVEHPPRSLERASALLRSAGFSRRTDGMLVDAHGNPVEFSILTNPSNTQRTKIATIIQDDLKQLGMRVNVVPLEFQAIMTRVFDSFDYEASILGLVSGDADPNPEINVWTSGGGTHLWDQTGTLPVAAWQAEIDTLMRRQTAVLDYKKRKQMYDRVQEIISTYDPVICVVSPNILVGAKNSLAGVRPSVMRNYLLWNAEQLFWRREAGKRQQAAGQDSH
ncbi:MAG TPA: ABC transporter substrate-binding protein [Candidatus Saccharimonadales bacterium]|jgi:peptide/nickel transport system substrate-binding protein|nr:ABC transporter substrate-binding protein [Candidatus Saccharimonadales bacterium]